MNRIATITVKYAQHPLSFFASSLDKYTSDHEGWAEAYTVKLAVVHRSVHQLAEAVFEITNKPSVLDWRTTVEFVPDGAPDRLRSLSVGDVLVIEYNDDSPTYVVGVDGIGFRNLEEK